MGQHLNIILTFSIVLLGCKLSNAQEMHHDIIHTGAGSIYGGKICILSNKIGPKLKPTSADVYVASTSLHAKADSNGIFYLPNVPSGNHTLLFKLKGYENFALDSVKVSPDSTTIVNYELIFGIGRKRFEWIPESNGLQLQGTDTSACGQIIGHLGFSDSPIPRMRVIVYHTFWEAESDSLGNYEIDHVMVGMYSVQAFSNNNYISNCEHYVKVKKDSAAVVDLGVGKMERSYETFDGESWYDRMTTVPWREKYTKLKQH